MNNCRWAEQISRVAKVSRVGGSCLTASKC